MKIVLGKPLISFLLERLRRVSLANQIVIATTTLPGDDQIIDFCQKEKVAFYRGSEEDLLSRYYGAAREQQADSVVRITSDCPLIDPKLVDQLIQYYLTHYPTFDYVSNTQERTYPRGMDTEVFSFKALELAYQSAKETFEREHVTQYFHRHKELFHLGSIKAETDDSRYRLTVDTPEDFELIKRILEKIYPKNPQFTLDEILQVLKENPEWPKINGNIQQKAV